METMISNCFELSGVTDTVTNGRLMANFTLKCQLEIGPRLTSEHLVGGDQTKINFQEPRQRRPDQN